MAITKIRSALQLQDGSITTSKILDASVTLAKLSPDVQLAILGGGGSSGGSAYNFLFPVSGPNGFDAQTVDVGLTGTVVGDWQGQILVTGTYVGGVWNLVLTGAGPNVGQNGTLVASTVDGLTNTTNGTWTYPVGGSGTVTITQGMVGTGGPNADGTKNLAFWQQGGFLYDDARLSWDSGNGRLLVKVDSTDYLQVDYTSIYSARHLYLNANTGGSYGVFLDGAFLNFRGSALLVDQFGKVGIGNATPAYLLDVAGDINTIGVYRVNGAQISSSDLSDGPFTGAAPAGAAGNIQFNSSPAGTLSADAGLRWDNTLKVLRLGTQNISEVGVLSVYVPVGSFTSPAGGVIGISVSDNVNSTMRFSIAPAPSYAGIIQADNRLLLKAADVDSIMIDGSTGHCYVGIGTTVPAGPLHIHAGANQNLMVDGAHNLADGVSIHSLNDAVTGDLGLEIFASTTQFTTGGIVVTGANQAGAAIYTSGRIGVGTAAPSYSVDVSGDVNVTGAYRVNGLPIAAGQWADTSGGIYRSSGVVGIGTNSFFDLSSAIEMSTGADNHWIFDSRTDSNPNGLAGTIFMSNDANTGIGHFAIYAASTAITGGDLLVQSGRLGVGTAAPAYPLDVAGDVNTSTAYRVNGAQISSADLSDGPFAAAVVFVDLVTPTSGSVDGINAVFSFPDTPVAGSMHLFLNGVLQRGGAGNDYTISGDTVTFATVPNAGGVILASYRV